MGRDFGREGNPLFADNRQAWMFSQCATQPVLLDAKNRRWMVNDKDDDVAGTVQQPRRFFATDFADRIIRAEINDRAARPRLKNDQRDGADDAEYRQTADPPAVIHEDS